MIIVGGYRILIKEAIPWFNKYPNEELNITKGTKLYKLWKYARYKEITLSQANKELYHKDGYFTHNFVYINRLSPTVLATHSLYHSYFPRLISIPEVKRIQTFPDDFRLTGTISQQWERVGRSVPPRMMEQVGLTIKKLLNEV